MEESWELKDRSNETAGAARETKDRAAAKVHTRGGAAEARPAGAFVARRQVTEQRRVWCGQPSTASTQASHGGTKEALVHRMQSACDE
jgi:hypothetical protein